MKFAFIARQRREEPSESVRLMCNWLSVSKSGFYAALRRCASKRSLSHQKLKLEIRAVHEKSRRRYGAPRVHAELRAHGETCGHNQVANLMREEGLRGKKKSRRFKVTTMSSHNKAVAPNLLARSFDVSSRQMNTAWAGDITYLPTREGWLYLAALIDLSSRRVVGWSLGSSLEETLTMNALKMALATRDLHDGKLLHHSDRGSQYASREYQSALGERGITPSMSGKGDCWDNAVAESFFATLKTEIVADAKWESRSQATREVTEYLNWYNFNRRHSTLGYLTPAEYEMKMLQESSPAA